MGMFDSSDDGPSGTSINADDTTRTEILFKVREKGEDGSLVMLSTRKWQEIRMNPGEGPSNLVASRLRQTASDAVEEVYTNNSAIVVRLYPGASVGAGAINQMEETILGWMNENRGKNSIKNEFEIVGRQHRTESVNPDNYSWMN